MIVLEATGALERRLVAAVLDHALPVPPLFPWRHGQRDHVC
jgi:hypothetical protein